MLKHTLKISDQLWGEVIMLSNNPICHKNDPDSSRIAANKITHSGVRATMQQKVLAAIKQYPNCTAAELAEYMNVDKYDVRRRLSDLKAAELVTPSKTKIRKCNVTNNASIVWNPA